MIEISDIKKICISVGEILGKGYNECIYQEGIALFLRKASIDYSKEVNLSVKIDDIIIGNVRADIVIPSEQIIIECKAIDGNLKLSHIPQLIKYLKITNYKKGVFVNFNQNPSKPTVELIEIYLENNLYKIKFDNDNDTIYCMNDKGLNC